jgi:hypothetical protein
MSNDTLELATTDELLAELFKRPTFAGVFVYSTDTHKFDGQGHLNLLVRTTCEDDSTLHLLEVGIKAINDKKVREDGS